MKITKAEYAAVLVAVLVLSFTVGFFLGRSSSPTTLVMETQSEAPSPKRADEIPTLQTESTESEPPDLSSEPAASVTETEMEDAQGLLNLNTATLEQLDELPGIGPVLAQRILDYRQEIGTFTSKEQLMNVSGIGEKKYADIEKLIEVGS